MSLDQARKTQFICRPNDFSLYGHIWDNDKKHDCVFIYSSQHENVSKAEVLAELENIAVMICKPT